MDWSSVNAFVGFDMNVVAMVAFPVFNQCPCPGMCAVRKELTLSLIYSRLKIPGNKLITETARSFHHIHQTLFHLKDSQRTF